MDFKHYEDSERYLSLHDCVSKKAYYENDILVFEFEDGFWILPDNPHNSFSETLKTDFSKVEFHLDKGIESVIYIFKKKLFGITIRKEITMENLIDQINKGKYELEFIYNYVDGDLRIIEAFINTNKFYRYECEIKMCCTHVKYYWNKLDTDRRW